MKDELKNTSIQITCLDEDGNVLKRVTSGDSGEIEEGDGENQSTENANENQNGNGSSQNSGSDNSGSNSGSGSENSGSGSQSATLAAPSLTGDTPFLETTQVTISGPDGAEIRYTTDGSEPTAQSTLYSEPFSLSATTTVKAIAIKDGESSSVAQKTYAKGTSGSESTI